LEDDEFEPSIVAAFRRYFQEVIKGNAHTGRFGWPGAGDETAHFHGGK